MNPRTQAVIAVAVIGLLGVVIWFGLSGSDRKIEKKLTLEELPLVLPEDVIPDGIAGDRQVSKLGIEFTLPPQYMMCDEGTAIYIKLLTVGCFKSSQDSMLSIYTYWGPGETGDTQSDRSLKGVFEGVENFQVGSDWVQGVRRLEGKIETSEVFGLATNPIIQVVLRQGQKTVLMHSTYFGDQFHNGMIGSVMRTLRLGVNDSLPGDEAAWDAYWKTLVDQTRVSSTSKQIGQFVLSVPSSLKEDKFSDGTTVYTFDEKPEGPIMTLAISKDSPETIIANVKSNLSEFEKIVNERSEIINGISWNSIQQTTDFGIDQVIWAARGSSENLHVVFTVTRSETARVFEDIVRSARISS